MQREKSECFEIDIAISGARKDECMDFKEVLEAVARQNNTTPEEVYIEMKKAIDEAWKDPTPEVIMVHEKMGFGDKAPTPDNSRTAEL